MIKIDFSRAPTLVRDDIVKTYNCALQHLGQDKLPLEVSVSFVSEKTIKEVNGQTRNINRATDVLSFPTVDNPTKRVLVAEDFCGLINPQTGAGMLGDVLICTKIAKRQAEEYGHSFTREACFLALHGLLHLLGYDHIDIIDEKEMTALQKDILQKVGIGRD